MKVSSCKFGTIKGVFIPDVLQMIGAILFIRLGWVLGHTGIGEMSIIITLSALLLFITGFSLSSIVSNMRMRRGGAYYLISRSLGIEFGSAIGVLASISQHCSLALCVSGFCLSLNEFFPQLSLPLIKVITLTSLVAISYISTNLALRTQTLIFFCLITSIAAIFLGSGPPNESLLPLPEGPPITFWMGFAFFFPAMTGIETGMAMAGDLRNPARSLPLGTLGAILVVYSIYMGIAFFLSAHVSPELLRSYPFILYHISKVGYLIIMGIWAATLSSAMGLVLGAPRVMQAIAKDGILPRFLAKGFGPLQQPRVATVVVFVIGTFLTVATQINQIIPILTMACLMSYGLINFIAFFQSFLRNPSWRPTIRTHWLLSLIGGIGCFVSMFMINAGASFIVLSLVPILYFWATRRNIKGQWDDLRHSLFSFFVQRGTIKLSRLEKNAKSWRPHILTLFDKPQVNKNLAFFAHALNQEKGFLTFGTSVEENQEVLSRLLKEDLKGFKIPSYIHVNQCFHPILGMDQIIKNYGFGLLKPNTVILPIPEKWEIDPFVQLLLDVHRQEKNIVLLKEDARRDYLFMDATRKGKQINLWRRSKYAGNFELSLALAYLLQQSKLWPRSQICIKMITRDEEQKTLLSTQFDTYKQKLRIKDLKFNALIDPEIRFYTNLLAHSQDADITFLGMRKPEPSTTLQEYKEYYLQLLENTNGLSNVAYILRGEKVKFRNIFI